MYPARHRKTSAIIASSALLFALFARADTPMPAANLYRWIMKSIGPSKTTLSEAPELHAKIAAGLRASGIPLAQAQTESKGAVADWCKRQLARNYTPGRGQRCEDKYQQIMNAFLEKALSGAPDDEASAILTALSTVRDPYVWPQAELQKRDKARIRAIASASQPADTSAPPPPENLPPPPPAPQPIQKTPESPVSVLPPPPPAPSGPAPEQATFKPAPEPATPEVIRLGLPPVSDNITLPDPVVIHDEAEHLERLENEEKYPFLKVAHAAEDSVADRLYRKGATSGACPLRNELEDQIRSGTLLKNRPCNDPEAKYNQNVLNEIHLINKDLAALQNRRLMEINYKVEQSGGSSSKKEALRKKLIASSIILKERGGYRYNKKTGVQPGDGINVPIDGGGTVIFGGSDNNASYCSGALYTIFTRTLLHVDNGAIFRQMRTPDGKPDSAQLASFKPLKNDDNGVFGIINNDYASVVDLNFAMGKHAFGKEIGKRWDRGSFEQACAGDMMKWNRTKTGHAGVFIAREKGYVYYWSSNGSTKGYGVTCEPEKQMKPVILRMTKPHNIAAIPANASIQRAQYKTIGKGKDRKKVLVTPARLTFDESTMFPERALAAQNALTRARLAAADQATPTPATQAR